VTGVQTCALPIWPISYLRRLLYSLLITIEGGYILNPKIFQTLEFEKIQQQVAKETRTEIGKIQALNLKPSAEAEEIEQSLQSVDDVKHLFELDKRIPVNQLINVKPFLK